MCCLGWFALQDHIKAAKAAELEKQVALYQRLREDVRMAVAAEAADYHDASCKARLDEARTVLAGFEAAYPAVVAEFLRKETEAR
jgi:hypothetical protein